MVISPLNYSSPLMLFITDYDLVLETYVLPSTIVKSSLPINARIVLLKAWSIRICQQKKKKISFPIQKSLSYRAIHEQKINLKTAGILVNKQIYQMLFAFCTGGIYLLSFKA